jgi:hypothetical protein
VPKRRRKPKPIVPPAGPVTITHADGSSEVQNAHGVRRGSRIVNNAAAKRRREAKAASEQAWQQTKPERPL